MADHRTKLPADDLEESLVWDESVLGMETGGAAKPPGSLVNASENVLSPLAQILLANTLTAPEAIEEFFHALPREPELPLLLQAERSLGLTPIPEQPRPVRTGEYYWVPLQQFSLMDQDSLFAYQVAETLYELDITRGLSEAPRQHLNNLLFQPLQNSAFYGYRPRLASQKQPFSGVALRIVDPASIAGPSRLAHLEAVSRYRDVPRLIEIIVHDDGPGIAEHFFIAHEKNPRSVYTETVAREWISLNRAFERHLSASPRFMERRVNQQEYEPGIGLFAVLNALHVLDGYMEVRCGRLRIYRSLLRGHRFRAEDPLIYPTQFPERACELIAGTIVRFLIPLEA